MSVVNVCSPTVAARHPRMLQHGTARLPRNRIRSASSSELELVTHPPEQTAVAFGSATVIVRIPVVDRGTGVEHHEVRPVEYASLVSGPSASSR